MSACITCGKEVDQSWCNHCELGDDCATNGRTLLESKWSKRLVVARNECDGR